VETTTRVAVTGASQGYRPANGWGARQPGVRPCIGRPPSGNAVL